MPDTSQLYSPKEKVERNKKVFELRKKGLSLNQIAGIIQTSSQNVLRILKLHKEKYS